MEKNNILAKKYNKKYALPTYSGTLAIEGVLKTLLLENNDRVLISIYSCYSILEAILNANLTPIIAIPKHGIVFTEEELIDIVKTEKINVYIAVHQYGYYQPIPKLKKVIILEDFSQAWDIKIDKYKVGDNSDYLISSFGKTKPLSNGIGGIILTNNNIENYFDLKTRDDRYKSNQLIEYYYSNKINYKKIIKRANKKVKKQRANVLKIEEIFQKYCFINSIEIKNSIPSYHRYLIQTNDVDKICSILNKCNILYQKEYKIKLSELPVSKKKNIKIVGKSNELNYLLIIPTNKMSSIKKLSNEMRKEYGK